MAKGVKVHVLRVGQGMGNFIQVFGNGLDKAPTNSMIFDLGSEKGKTRFTPIAVNIIIKNLLKMDPPRKLDMIVFSHGDKDHWNIFRDLIIKCSKDVAFLQYGEVYFGGTRDQYSCTISRKKYNILDDLERNGADVQDQFINAYNSFDTKLIDDTWPVLANFNGFKVRILMSNVDNGIVLNDPGTETEFTNKNSVSAVLVCEYAGKRFIFSGDATGLTVKMINELIKTRKIEDQVNNTFMLVTPHHGSAVTLKYGKDPFEPAKTFASYCDAECISASADFRTGFYHPDIEVLEIFAEAKLRKVAPMLIENGGYTPPLVEDEYPKHLFTAYDSKGWRSFSTEDNVFTTYYSLTESCDWIFTVDENGTMTIERNPSTALGNVKASSRVLAAINKKRPPGSNTSNGSSKKPKPGKYNKPLSYK